MRRTHLLRWLLAALASGCSGSVWAIPAADTMFDSLHLKYGVAGARGRILDKDFYIINYSDQWRTACWSAYCLTPADLKGKAPRRNNFQPDLEVPPEFRSELADYRGSGFDRGHLAPAGAFTRSREAMAATFLLSNMSPQYPNTNRGIWKSLEDQIRELVKGAETTWVITGNAFLDQDSQAIGPLSWTRRAGRKRVAVPTHLFDAILVKEGTGRWCAYAFLVPNLPTKNRSPTAAYRLSVDRLEQLTGFDFFVLLDTAVQNRVESRAPAWTW